ncbi:hypothetical protein M5D96_003252 [Drosophila gunungcola]|uniref:C-type lectin domain-containing protein n=1 Tax=Drosophila gunungcola TaxID=103775 RepID=A0A9P9YRX8_9MUSC|nr:hypothetical protein M5D96_003252 [Drosophila gunungcola]
MFSKLTLFIFLGLFTQFWTYEITPIITEGAPDFFDISTEPFVKIGEGYYYFETNLTKNWFDAFESCRRMDAQLIAFETMKEWDLLNIYLRTAKIEDIYWTSGTDLAHHGIHDWFPTGQRLTLDIWMKGEPNNSGGNEHCDILGYRRTETNYNDLNDLECELERLYICEAPLPRTASFVIW